VPSACANECWEVDVRVLIGVILSFFIGAGCRYFDIPAASPPVLPGALIVLAMTLGYTSVDRILNQKGQVATTKPLCGGPTGATTATVETAPKVSQPDFR
jgi:XapX domain-containing protein